MKLRAWTIIYCPRAQPEVVNNIYTLNSFMNPIHTSLMIDHSSYAMILQIHTLNLPKIHKKGSISTASSPVSCSIRFTVRSVTWLECTIQTGVCVTCVHMPGAHNKYLWCISNFLMTKISETSFYFYNRITELKMIHFEKVRYHLLKQLYLFLKMWSNIDYQPVLTGYLARL